MDSFISTLKDEERSLMTRLAAIQKTIAAYGGEVSSLIQESETKGREPVVIQTVARTDMRVGRDKRDRFGSYGGAIVASAYKVLPDDPSEPVMTRDVLEAMLKNGVVVRGDNQVNALSALLSRSSHIKSYGRRGWTRAANSGGDVDGASAENEVSHGNAGDTSDAGAQDVGSVL